MQTFKKENLVFRSDVLRKIRRFFYDRSFCEVQTPILSADIVIDRCIEPISVTENTLPVNHHGTKNYYLQTSPESAMKRLLAGGMESIFQITPVFRSGDRGTLHNPEFTMLEWYRTGDDYQSGMNLLAELVQSLLPEPEIEFRTFRDVFVTKTGLNPHRTSLPELHAAAEQFGVNVPDSYQSEPADAWIDLLFAEYVQPDLQAVIVFDYPASQSQLAQVRRENDAAVSERFELFLGGLEIANGYHELCDADELRRRFQENNRHRIRSGRQPLPEKNRLLTAMEQGLPPCSGTALGIDRLLMAMLRTAAIDDVMTFPVETA